MTYYETLDQMLQEAGQGGPCLILDLDRYERNIAVARRQVQPGVGLRVVAKSLACLEMLDMAVDGLDALGVMTFSARMLDLLLQQRSDLDHLLGKPLPVRSAAEVLAVNPAAAGRVVWLIDTEARAAQYADLARARGQDLRVALEVDVGLHRGGVTPDQMGAVMAQLTAMDGLLFEGVMGYEPHLASLPGPLHTRARRQVEQGLAEAGAMARDLGANLVNTGGSKTFSRYGPAHGISEVSLGSVLVKPTDFDAQVTEDFEPALFIATPILKYMPRNPLPGLDFLQAISNWRTPAHLAVYGGYWKAQPVHPAGYGYSGVFGHSSNQEVWSGPLLADTPVDQFAILRPTQSEAVLPEFGEVLVVSGGQIRTRWPCLPVAQ